MKKIFLMTIIMFLFVTFNKVDAGDYLYRITHNDHEVLIIGEITQITNTKMKASVAKTIVSTEYMNQIGKKVQLNPSNVTIDLSDYKTDIEFNVGDYILASLDKTLIEYRIANGIYKVDSLDNKTLKILSDKKEKNSDLIALEYFINSNGTINQFAFEGNKIYITNKNGEEIVLYNNSDQEYEATLALEDETTIEQVMAKEYDDAMVVTIILTAGIMIVIVLFKFRTKVDD